MRIDPYSLHPELKGAAKNLKKTLTLQSVHDTIMSKMVEVRNESQPYSAHAEVILLELLFELEEKCQNN